MEQDAQLIEDVRNIFKEELAKASENFAAQQRNAAESTETKFSIKSDNDIEKFKKMSYNQYRSERLAFENDSSPAGTQRMLYNPQMKQYEVWEKGDDALLITGIAKSSGEAEKLYERIYGRYDSSFYGNIESAESSKGKDIWNSSISENRGNDVGNDRNAERERREYNSGRSGADLSESNNEKSLNEPSSKDGGFSMPKFSVDDEAYMQAVNSGDTEAAQRNAAESSENKMSFDDENAFAEYNKPITESDIKALQSIGRKSINAFTGKEIEAAHKWAYKFYQQMGTKSPFFRAWFGDWRAYDIAPVNIVGGSTTQPFKAGKTQNNDTGFVISWGNQVKGETRQKYGTNSIQYKALDSINEIVKNAVLLNTESSTVSSGHKMPNTNFMHSFYAVLKEGDYDYVLKLVTEEAHSNDLSSDFLRAYELQNIEKVAELHTGVHAKSGLTRQSTTIDNVSDLYSFVKQYDKKFTAGKPVNKEFINEDGTPKVFYHGTTNNEFTVFDFERTKNGSLGRGFYFSGSKEYAKGHTVNNGKFSGRIIEAFISIKNPYIAKYSGQIDTEKLKLQGYDGVYSPANDFVVVFDSKNIKSVTDNIGTFSGSPDIRFSFAEDNDIDSFYGGVIRENQNLRWIFSQYDDIYSSRRLDISLNQDDIDRVARTTLKKYSSKYDVNELSERLTAVYDYLEQTAGRGQVDSETISNALFKIAKDILLRSERLDTEVYDSSKPAKIV